MESSETDRWSGSIWQSIILKDNCADGRGRIDNEKRTAAGTEAGSAAATWRRDPVSVESEPHGFERFADGKIQSQNKFWHGVSVDCLQHGESVSSRGERAGFRV